MKQINRNEAYRLIYAQARTRGWDNDELHDNLELWGFKPASLKAMDAVKLHQVLECLGFDMFVRDPGSVAQLSIVYPRERDRIDPYILKRFQKETIYQLNNQQARSVLAMLNNYKKSDSKPALYR